MIFNPSPLAGAFTIDLEPRKDSRGFFSRMFCAKEFEGAGIESNFVQANNSLCTTKGTLRGMHYQLTPAAETKLVRCLRGSLYDVIIDLRPQSKTYLQWFGAELTAENRTMMFVPRGFAHGLITLEDDTELMYMVSAYYAPEQERGICFDDKRIDIQWPIDPVEVVIAVGCAILGTVCITP